MGRLSKGLEWLIKEQRLNPEPEQQPIEKIGLISDRVSREFQHGGGKVKVAYFRMRRVNNGGTG